MKKGKQCNDDSLSAGETDEGASIWKIPTKKTKNLPVRKKKLKKVGPADDILSSSKGSDPPHSGAEDK